MQNISFLVIVGVLLSCAFFFSEQTRGDDDPAVATVTEITSVESREDLPDCSGLANDSGLAECYQDSAALSQRLVEKISDQILSQESESADRIGFLDMQQTWEESRDADCGFVQVRAETDAQGEIVWDQCQVEHNLTRLDQLEVYLCEYYDKDACEASIKSLP